MQISIFFCIFAARMQESKEILQFLIRNCFFAPNQSRLASLLGQRGRMNIARLSSDNIGERALDKLWNELCEVLSVPEDLMPFLPDVWILSDILKVSENTLPIEVAPEEFFQPHDIGDHVWLQILNLYQKDPLLYYMLVAITYAKRHKINPYQQKLMKGSEQTVKAIDEQLHQLYPQQVNAHDAAKELLRTLEGLDVDSWWWIGFFGGSILRLYYDPTYIESIFKNCMYTMPIPDWQWWRNASINHPTNTLWYWQKNGNLGAVYEVMRLEEDQDATQAIHFQLIFVGSNTLRIVHHEGENTKSMFLEWQMQMKEGICSLRFNSSTDNELSSLLPQELIMLVPKDDPILVDRAEGMTESMQHEIYMRVYREIGLEPTDEYTIEDIECSRRNVKILYRNTNTKKMQVAKFGFAEYPALRSITVHIEIDLFKGCKDNRLYALWNSVGVLIPIN